MSKCGECLMRDVEIVELVNNVCPVCGADYRADFPINLTPTDAEKQDVKNRLLKRKEVK